MARSILASNEIQLIGLTEAVQAFNQLEKKFRKKIVKSAVTKGTAEIRKSAIRKARKNTGIMRKSIKSKVFTKRGLVGRVGYIFKAKNKHEYYPNTAQKDFENGIPVALVVNVEAQRTNFLENALAESGAIAIEKTTQAVFEGIDKLL